MAVASLSSIEKDFGERTLFDKINLTVYDHGAAARLKEIFEEDLKHAKQITYEEWKTRGIYERLVDLFTFPVKDQL